MLTGMGEARRLAAQIASRLGEWGDRGQAPGVGRGEWGELLGWTQSLEELLAGVGRGQGRGEAAAMDGAGEGP